MFLKSFFRPELRYFFSGTFYTSLSSVSGLLVPLLVVPYLIGRVGLENYGISAVAFSVSFFMAMIVEFGFNITGVNKISKEENYQLKAKIISNIFYSKVAIFLVLLPFVLLGYSFVFVENIEFKVYVFSLAIPLASVFNFNWALQGLHKLKIWSILTILGQSFYVILIFLFINKSNDFIYINLFYALGLLLYGIISMLLLTIRFKLRIRGVDLQTIILELKESYHFFLSNICNYASLYFLSPLIGFLISYEMAGVYSIIEKIYNIARRPFSIYQTFMLPKVSEMIKVDFKVAKSYIKKTYIFVILFAIFEIVFIIIFKEKIVIYFSKTNLTLLNDMLLISALGLIFVIINCPITLFLIALDKKLEFMRMSLSAPIFGIIIGFVFISFFDILGSVFTLLSIELFYALYLLYVYFNIKEPNLNLKI